MEFQFGPGQVIVTPLTDYAGNTIANPSPRRLGAFQEATFDNSAEVKMMYGPNQYPLAVGRGKAKLSMKVKMGQLSVDQINAVFIGQPANQTAQIAAAVIDTTGILIPSTPYTITAGSTSTTTTIQIPSSGTWARDLGVTDTTGAALTAVASAPATGQYTVAAGVYVFASADVGKRVFISYAYTATSTSAKQLIVNNAPMGNAPFLLVDFFSSYGGNALQVTMYQAIATKFNFGTKLDDFVYPEIELEGFANSSNQAYLIAASQ